MRIADQVWMQRVVAENEARLRGYAQAWEAYFGRFKEPLRTKPGQPNDNAVVNFVRLIADKCVAYLFGQEPEFEIDDGGEGSEDSPAEEWLAECWRRNHKMLLLQKIALNGAICGHAFVKIVPGDETRTGGAPYPKLVNLSPEYLSVVTDPDDIDTVWRYIIQYPAVGREGERLTIRQVIERSDGGGWSILDQVARGSEGFVTRATTSWPWDWAPIVDCQNLPSPNEYYGIANIEADVVALNDTLNFLLSNMVRIIRYHAHPKTWGRGFEAKELRVGADELIIVETPNGELHNLEMQSDLASSIELYKQLKEALHEVTRIPEVATGKVDSVGTLSGVALQILYAPLVEQTEAKRLTYGEMLTELNRRLLEMGGFGADNRVEIHWPELLVGDPLQERQVAVLDKQLGVSGDTILERLGFDPQLERDKRGGDDADLGEKLLTAFERGADMGRQAEPAGQAQPAGPNPEPQKPSTPKTQGRR